MIVLQMESPNPVPWAKLFTLTKRFVIPGPPLIRMPIAPIPVLGDVECYILAFLVIPVTDVPGGGELEGIAYQIGNDLENPVLVSVNHDILVRGFVYQLHSFGTAENMCVVYLLAEWMENVRA